MGGKLVDVAPAPHRSCGVMLFHAPGILAVDPLLVLFGALLLDAWLGDMTMLFRRVPHPIALIGRAVAWLDVKLNREQRSEQARFARGIVTVTVLVIAVLIAQRSLFDRVQAVGAALADRGLQAGREEVRHIVGRDPQSLDAYGVARAGTESLAENFSDGVVAPVFWTVLFGLPGLFVYKTANTLDSMIGHLSPRYQSFGWAAARFDDLLNLVPARLSGVLIAVAAAVTPKASGVGALRIMLRDAGKHRSPNAGWPEAAMAGALGIALAGPRRYAERVVEDPWLGDGRARVTPSDVHRALLIYVIACALLAVVVLGLYLLLPGR
jgi:adenosylcobinamide-phosphate synthase